MMHKVRRSYRAEEDLILIWQHVAADNPVAADRLLDRIEEKWQHLASYPYFGPACDDLALGVRYLVTGKYLSFYRIDNDEVLILRVMHGHRKIVSDDLTD